MGRDLIKNKTYGIIFIVIGAFTVPIEWDATFFLFTLMLGFAIGRAERRRALKSEQKNKTATYNLTKAQLDALVRERISEEMDRARQDGITEGVNQTMILLLTLPLEVLMDYYWKKSYYKRIPEFTKHVLEYYEMWQNG